MENVSWGRTMKCWNCFHSLEGIERTEEMEEGIRCPQCNTLLSDRRINATNEEDGVHSKEEQFDYENASLDELVEHYRTPFWVRVGQIHQNGGVSIFFSALAISFYIIAGIWLVSSYLTLLESILNYLSLDIRIIQIFLSQIEDTTNENSWIQNITAFVDFTKFWAIFPSYALVIIASLIRPSPILRNKLKENKKLFFIHTFLALIPISLGSSTVPLFLWFTSTIFTGDGALKILILYLPIIFFLVTITVLSWLSANTILLYDEKIAERSDEIRAIYSIFLCFSLVIGLIPLHYSNLIVLTNSTENHLYFYIPFPSSLSLGVVLDLAVIGITSSAILSIVLFGVFTICALSIIRESTDDVFRISKERNKESASDEELLETKQSILFEWINPLWRYVYLSRLALFAVIIGSIELLSIAIISLTEVLPILLEHPPEFIVQRETVLPEAFLVQLAWKAISEEISFRVLLIGVPVFFFAFFFGSNRPEFTISNFFHFLREYSTGGFMDRLDKKYSGLILISGMWSAWYYLTSGIEAWWEAASVMITGLIYAYIFLRYGLTASIFLHYYWEATLGFLSDLNRLNDLESLLSSSIDFPAGIIVLVISCYTLAAIIHYSNFSYKFLKEKLKQS